ncbi:MAG UNVERIFIED_CONTAM: hypothetical protein LVR18_44460 [Planctomycetaceae bacterium]
MQQQYRTVHPYTGAAPGGWSWTDLPGGVPDADDTPGSMLALLNLRLPGETYTEAERQSLQAAGEWLLGLQNRDGGWPTFCRGWAHCPSTAAPPTSPLTCSCAFQLWQDRIGLPTPAYAVAMQRGLAYLSKQQRPDGTWLPLWFGNQHHPHDENPLYGTTRVLRALTVTACRESLRHPPRQPPGCSTTSSPTAAGPPPANFPLPSKKPPLPSKHSRTSLPVRRRPKTHRSVAPNCRVG